MKLLNSKTILVLAGILVLGILVMTANEPVRQAVLGDRQLLPFLQPNPSSTDEVIQEWLEQNPSIDATTLLGHDGLYYLQAGNLIGKIANEQFSAYENLVAEGKIADGSTIATDANTPNPPNSTPTSPTTTNSATHDPVSVLDSTTFDFTISGQQISGSVIQSGLKTSLFTNDAGFISSLVSFTTSNLTEGSNLYWTQGRFNAAFSGKSTSNLAEGSNLYYTQGRFNAAFGNKTTDQLTEGSSNLYSQWAIATGGITFGNSVGIGSSNAPGATLDVTGSFAVSGAISASNFTLNGGLLYTNGSGVMTQLAVGTAGQCLKSTGGVPAWGACAAGDSITGSGTTGQLAYFNSDSTLAGGSGLTWDPDNSTLTVAGNITMSGSIIPSADITYDLGSPTMQWKDVYIGPGSLYINGQKVLQESGESIVVSADPDQNLVMQTTNTGDIEFAPLGSGAIQLKGNVLMTGGKTFRTSDNSALLFSDGIQAGNLLLSGNIFSTANTNGDIEFSPNGNGDSYFSSGNVGIGNTGPSHSLDVTGTFRATGQTTLSNYATNGGLLLTNASGVVSQTAAGTAGQCLQSAGGGAPTWGACNAANTVTGSGVSGRVAFWDGENSTASSSNLLWNNTNSRLRIGSSTPDGPTLAVSSANNSTDASLIQANALTTGKGLLVSSTSTTMTTGGLLGLSWLPGSATTMTGDLFSINVGPNGTVGNLLNLMNDGLSVFSVSQSQIVANVPVSFRAAGNMSVAYDLVFTNSTSANIDSAGPLRIQAGEVFNSSDLTLGTYNNGAIVFDSAVVATNNDTMLGLGVYLPTARLSLAADTVAAGGIAFGTDTNLYRSAADTLRTDDLFVSGGGITWVGSAAPSLSATGNARSYFDNTSNTLKLSENGGGYTDVLSAGRAIQSPLSTKTAAYTIAASDSIILTDTTSGTFAITLPSATGITGKQYTIKQMSAADFATIETAASETIDGAAGYTFSAQYETITVASDGANWVIISNK